MFLESWHPTIVNPSGWHVIEAHTDHCFISSTRYTDGGLNFSEGAIYKHVTYKHVAPMAFLLVKFKRGAPFLTRRESIAKNFLHK